MFSYKITLMYDGTIYSGWQIQPNAPTIQQMLQEALSHLIGGPAAVVGSGRTDSGVHAMAQVAHFRTEKEFEPAKLQLALNGLLPPDIRIKLVQRVPIEFHAQYDATGKEYHYHLYLKRVMDPFCRFHCWHVKQQLNLPLLYESASLFIGTHDFSSFANQTHCEKIYQNPTRILYRLDLFETEGGIRLEFEGNGFLYKMVRNIVGTMIDVASSRIPLDAIEKIFSAKDRRQAGQAAPPTGLFLMRVDYPENHLKMD
jgi:tRNA pseudouridine38-40 synthase